MDENKYKFTFIISDHKEDHPEIISQYPLKVEDQGQKKTDQLVYATAPPRLPIGRNRKVFRERRDGVRTYNYQANPPEQNQGKELGLRHKRRGSRPLLIALAAVAVGIIMGLSVLSMFAQQEELQPAGGQSEAPVITPSEGQDTLRLPAGYVEDGYLYLPARTYHVVQVGAFSESESAQSVLQQMQDAGLAAQTFEMEETFRLYSAMGVEQEEGEQWSQLIQGEGMEAFLRVHQTQEVQLELHGAEAELGQLPSFLARGDQLLNHLLAAAGSALVNEEKISDTDWQDLEEKHRLVLTAGQQVLSQVDDLLFHSTEQLMRELSMAVSALAAYRNQPHVTYLWQVQQACLNYLLSYEALLSQLEKISSADGTLHQSSN